MQKTPPLSKYSKKILIPNFFCLQVSRNKWKKEEEEKMWIIKRKTVYHNKTQPLGLLICTLISENQGLENQGLENQGLLQTLEKYQVLHTWIFFWFRGCSQTTLTKSGHFWTTHLPRLVNVVCERPFTVWI